MMHGLWGFYFANDDEAENLAAKQPLTGLQLQLLWGSTGIFQQETVPLQCRSLCQRNRTWSLAICLCQGHLASDQVLFL